MCRLTAVFTPAVAKVAGQYVSSSEWTACGMALAGGMLISLDSLLASADSSAKDASLGKLQWQAMFCTLRKGMKPNPCCSAAAG